MARDDAAMKSTYMALDEARRIRGQYRHVAGAAEALGHSVTDAPTVGFLSCQFQRVAN